LGGLLGFMGSAIFLLSIIQNQGSIFFNSPKLHKEQRYCLNWDLWDSGDDWD
jgi:hypothetical protein